MIVEALEELGPCLSTTLTSYLVDNCHLSPAAARQRISRAPRDKIRRLSSLPFARGAAFVYLKSQYGTDDYWGNLYEAIFSVEGTYSRALAAVLSREVMPVHHFHIACGAPVAQKGHIASRTALKRLTDAGVLAEITLPGLGTCVTTRQTQISSELDSIAASVRSRLMAEAVLLDSVREWLRNLALASFNSVLLRGGSEEPLPTVGTFNWDLSAPSYCAGLAPRRKGEVIPGFVACDVLLLDNIDTNAIKPFLHKMQTLQALKNIGRIMFIMVGQHFESDAFKELRKEGAIPATPESLFGKEIAATFRDLIKTLKDAVQGVVDSAKLDDLFTKLGKLEGALGNMRGAFFELLVAEIVRKTFPGEVQLNKICVGEDGKAEVDVWAVKEGVETRIIECKGMAPGTAVSDEEISLWLNTRIKRVRHHLKSTLPWNQPKPRFELWTSGLLSHVAQTRIKKTRNANAKKFDLIVVGPEELRKAAKSVNDASLLKTLEHHFIPAQ
ncbi:hypothetical protein QK357_13100 [Pseudomonas aeruginosa]|uniref:hypothetical protein n=1 Tax=Pseudomonas aeruginosa TaxID=287 RepID=UPI00249E7E74|nr:hypothetical protein [Pseudomonas aeruginosa]MDI3771275.1 hypothetical protein [Pseudomonas aeruginosa]MDI3980970.1 hypothetical protein [Pseudomonas aeruginosa]MDP5408170.1 hypothetical protein [Pseudomonas aeruginosa]MDT0990071.1 hypothetical protein [Pseudomonas aeruginosa]